VSKVKLLASLRLLVVRPFATLQGASLLSLAPGNFSYPTGGQLAYGLFVTYTVPVPICARDEAPETCPSAKDSHTT
jgi:hypothetical protein